MKVKSESEVAQSCPTLSNPMDCSLPGSSIHGIFQARVLEWGAIAFSMTRESSLLTSGGSMNTAYTAEILSVWWASESPGELPNTNSQVLSLESLIQ